MDNYTFRKAEAIDVENIIQLIEKRIKWMDTNNIQQWNKTNYFDSYPRAYFFKKVTAGELYVMDDQLTGKAAGAVVLLEEDKRWARDGSNSLYIHNLVSDTGVSGAGRMMIKSCEQIAIDNAYDAVRLDCQASNIKLNEYYKKQGYCYSGDVKDGNYIGKKREKKMGKYL
ncbi:GNAT family N-acetyltransferase [Bacillus salacetis]|nr:GNAT family N-acetyltransferase [Bacillus salacetis]